MRILLAIDESKFSEAAIEAVIEQARPHGTEVRVLHVLESPPLLVAREMGGYDPALETAWESQRQRAKAVVAKAAELLRARGLKVAAAVEGGDPKSKILDVAEERHAASFCRLARALRNAPEAAVPQTRYAAVDWPRVNLTVPPGGNS